MREHISGRGSAVIAVVACLLVVGSALAVAPGTASAAHVDGEISYSESDGEVTVTVDVRNASDGGFTGGEESVMIQVGGESVSSSSPTTPEKNTSTYNYTVNQDALDGVNALDNGSSVQVAVFHDGQNDDSFNQTVEIRYLALRPGGSFTNNGELRLPVGTAFGVVDGASVPVELEAGDRTENPTATYDASDSSLVVSRDTLSRLGTFENPQQIAVSGGASYVQGEIQVNPRDEASTTGERLSDGAVRFQSPLFEDGQTYVVNASIGDPQYLQTVDAADDQTIEINSRAVAAESSVTLTVKNGGNTLVNGESIDFPSDQIKASTNGAVVKFNESVSNLGRDVTTWIRTGADSSPEQYTADLDAENRTLDNFSERPSWPNRTATTILISNETTTLRANVSLQQLDGNASATPSGSEDQPADESESIISKFLPFLAVILGIIVVAVAVFLALQKFGSGTTKLNLGPFGSSNGDSPGESPGVETADVTVEVVDEATGKTYPHATNVIARQRNQGRSSGSRMGSGPGGTAGGAGFQGVNTDDTETIDLTAGNGEVELGYGDWVFEVRQNGETIGQRRHTLSYGYESDHIALSVDPYVVEATVTGGPNREPLQGAKVEATADAGGWKRRQPTDGEGRAQFEVPRSASTVSFTATSEDLPPAESQYRIEQAVQDGVNLSIADGAGTMRVETTVGDLSWPGVEVELTPISEEAKAYASDGTFTVNSEGRQRVEGLPAGEYEVRAHPQLEAVETTAAVERVTVGDGDTAEVTLSIGISYRMSAAERDRLDELSARIDGLSSEPDRDVAIQRYYGTVLTSVLDVVEDVESAPERAVEMGFSPDETVEALLDATEAGITAVDGAMSERRNVSLFGACESMSPATVEWNGTATLDAFFDRVEEGRDHERRALSDRLRAVDEVLDQQWGEVNEIAPARKLHDRIGELARETGNVDDELTAVAQAYLGICLLDAVEGIFDHDALVDRLNSGSY